MISMANEIFGQKTAQLLRVVVEMEFDQAKDG
jgi:hypothetical protein